MGKTPIYTHDPFDPLNVIAIEDAGEGKRAVRQVARAADIVAAGLIVEALNHYVKSKG